MCDNYFERLCVLARKLDKGIEELEDEWKLPQLFVHGCAEVPKETEERIESLKNFMQCTQDGVNELLKTMETQSDIGTLITEAQLQYDTIKEHIDNLETVFKEYGYSYDKNSDHNSVEIKKTEITSDSLEDENCTEEVIFTPYLSWRCKKKSINKTSLNGSEHILEKSTISCEIPNDILTSTNYQKKPVNIFDSNNKLQRIMLNKNIRQSNEIHQKYLTPLRNRPQEQIYSKHFYSSSKKNINQ